MVDQHSRVFISYARADNEFAQRLAAYLEATGLSTWMDSAPAELQFSERSRRAIDASDVVVVILTPEFLASEHAREELSYALLTMHKDAIFVLYRDIDIATMPAYLMLRQIIDFRQGQGQDDRYRSNLDRLVRAIHERGSWSISPMPPTSLPGPSGAPSAARRTWPPSTPAARKPPAAYVPPARTPVPQHSTRPHFTAFHSNTMPVETWNMLLVYSHSADGTSGIQQDAMTFSELGSAPFMTHSQSTQKIPHGTEITVEPHANGVAFSPVREHFTWDGEWHRSLFKCKGEARLAGTTAQGWVDVYAGRISPIATLELTLPFHTGIPTASLKTPRGMVVTTNTYDTVFISYSHRDVEAFQQARQLYERLGVTVYIDEWMEAGDNYDKRLKEMVEAAQVFHLLWSHNSARSDYVRKEWTWALEYGKGERFIRPWYWMRRLAPPPPELEQQVISFRYEHLQRRLLRPSTWL